MRHWSACIPSTDGHYWARWPGDRTCFIVCLWARGDGTINFMGYEEEFTDPRAYSFEYWADPICPPDGTIADAFDDADEGPK